MKINTNSWNKIRYTIYTPIYDSIGRIFAESRKKSISSLEIKKGDKVLIIGAGTGLDLEFLSPNCEITATDITPSMIKRLSKRSKKLNLNVDAQVMDGQKLLLPDNSYDKIILHLILAVIPNPFACIKEVERVLKTGGTIAVFDKFLPTKSEISFGRKLLNQFTNFFFSDITRSIEKIISETKFSKESDIKADFGGLFRIIKLRKG